MTHMCNKPNIREKVTLTKVPHKISCELPLHYLKYRIYAE